MDEDEITQRLREAGDRPVPGDIRDAHLHQMRAVAPAPRERRRFGRLAVAAAAIAGFVVGSTGFAMAGALPEPAQQVAHDVLAVVNVNVDNPRANRGQCISGVARDGSLTPEQKADAKQQCKDEIRPGRPDGVGKGRPHGVGNGRPEGAGPPAGHRHDGDPCKGPPPWAGRQGGATPQERADRDACPPDVDDDPAAIEEPQETEPEEIEPEEIEPPEPEG